MGEGEEEEHSDNEVEFVKVVRNTVSSREASRRIYESLLQFVGYSANNHEEEENADLDYIVNPRHPGADNQVRMPRPERERAQDGEMRGVYMCETCVICQEPMSGTLGMPLRCRHVVHSDVCFQATMENFDHCPICRQEF